MKCPHFIIYVFIPYLKNIISLFLFKVMLFKLQGDRATSYGVALLLVLFGSASENNMLQSISPSVDLIDENGLENARKKIRLE